MVQIEPWAGSMSGSFEASGTLAMAGAAYVHLSANLSATVNVSGKPQHRMGP